MPRSGRRRQPIRVQLGEDRLLLGPGECAWLPPVAVRDRRRPCRCRAVSVSPVVAGRHRTHRPAGVACRRPVDPAVDDVSNLAVDSFVDASGAPAAVMSGVAAVRSSGSVVLVGMGPKQIPMPIPTIQNRELTVPGVFRYANTWPTAIELVERGLVELDSMASGHFDLDSVEEVFRSTLEPETLKSVVQPNPS